ncbi:hypothetical protein DASC09_061860 [Saccharomycopsis crataegensis]|uniref:Uncharacterized protein n=1 Tax=Saccharomycopsis crataegensis TaxID=43959 RepID=A0AAV5QVB6_9ASCO|nr:hypothetical protein DASC09_061860 [Saccharomycopsis crataegensis]
MEQTTHDLLASAPPTVPAPPGSSGSSSVLSTASSSSSSSSTVDTPSQSFISQSSAIAPPVASNSERSSGFAGSVLEEHDFSNNDSPMCESEVLQVVFNSIKCGLSAVSKFSAKFEKYLDQTEKYYSDDSNHEKEMKKLAYKFLLEDLSLSNNEEEIKLKQINNSAMAEQPFDTNDDKKDNADMSIPNLKSAFVNSSRQKQLARSYFESNKKLYHKLLNEIKIQNPRFLKHEHSSTVTKGDSVISVNFSKINRNLKKAEEILNSYQKKINKMNTDCKKIMDSIGKLSSKSDSKILLQKRNALITQHHNTIEFSVFLTFKLFKFEILEYFLYIRDNVPFTHEIWKVLNFREVYQTLYQIVLYFEYCSSTITMSKQSATPISFILPSSQREASLKKYGFDVDYGKQAAVQSSNKLKASEVSTCLSEKELMEEYPERYKRFSAYCKKLFGFVSQIDHGKSKYTVNQEHFYHKLAEIQGETKSEKILKKDNILTKNFISCIYHHQSLYEVLSNLMINYHLRYLKLIDKFVTDNKDSDFFSTNLLPVCGKSQDAKVTKKFSSSNKFETLIMLIKSKIRKNILKLQMINQEFINKFIESDYKILAVDKFNILKQLPELMVKSMRILSDSFDYIFSLIPLFPVSNPPNRLFVAPLNQTPPLMPMGSHGFLPPPPIPVAVLSPMNHLGRSSSRTDRKRPMDIGSSSSSKNKLSGGPSAGPNSRTTTSGSNSASTSNQGTPLSSTISKYPGNTTVGTPHLPPSIATSSLAPTPIQYSRKFKDSRHHHHQLLHRGHLLRSHIHQKQSRHYNAYYNQYYNGRLGYGTMDSTDTSFLSTSWFILHDLKRKFNDLINGSFGRYGKFLNSIDDIDLFFNELGSGIGAGSDVAEDSSSAGSSSSDKSDNSSSNDESSDQDSDKRESKRRKLNNPVSTGTRITGLGFVAVNNNNVNNNLSGLMSAQNSTFGTFKALQADIDKSFDDLIQSIDTDDNLTELTNFIIL